MKRYSPLVRKAEIFAHASIKLFVGRHVVTIEIMYGIMMEVPPVKLPFRCKFQPLRESFWVTNDNAGIGVKIVK